MSSFLIFSFLAVHVFGLRSSIHDFLDERSPSFEWTAWGDSYASGVGAGIHVDGRRCLQCDGACPVDISIDADNLLVSQGSGAFNNVVRSGAKVEDVEAYQFYTKEADAELDWLYYPRPSSGRPSTGTLTVNGDDVDFPGILNSCIIEGLP